MPSCGHCYENELLIYQNSNLKCSELERYNLRSVFLEQVQNDHLADAKSMSKQTFFLSLIPSPPKKKKIKAIKTKTKTLNIAAVSREFVVRSDKHILNNQQEMVDSSKEHQV